jgi:uncharacterized membrane protein
VADPVARPRRLPATWCTVSAIASLGGLVLAFFAVQGIRDAVTSGSLSANPTGGWLSLLAHLVAIACALLAVLAVRGASNPPRLILLCAFGLSIFALLAALSDGYVLHQLLTLRTWAR